MHREPSAALIMWNSRIRRSFHLPTADTTKKQFFAIQVLSSYLATCTRLWHRLSRSILTQAVCQCTHYSPPHLVERGRMFVQWQWARHTPALYGPQRNTCSQSHPHCRSTHPTNHRSHHHFHLKKRLKKEKKKNPQSPFLSCMELHNNVSPDGLLII